MNKILVLQGVPASGKTTWAKEFVKDKKDWIIVSRDEIREATGKYWVPKRENYISEVEEFQVKSAIKNNLNVIVDATNLNPKTIEKWKNLAEELYTEIEFRTFYIDFKTALERDIGRPRSVGKKVLEGFFLRYFPEELKAYYTDNRKICEYDIYKSDCIIVDLDGTLAIHQGRNPYDLTKVNEDLPNLNLVRLLQTLSDKYKIFYISGREDSCREATEDWILKHVCNSDTKWVPGFNINHELLPNKDRLLMRKTGDYRSDEIIKEEIYHTYIELNYNVIAVFDDRNKVVQMWRHKLGLLTLQVYEGDF